MGNKKSEFEPIKASTLSLFEWNPVDAFIEHLKEIGDPRVSSTPKESEAVQEGEKLHEESFGLLVTVMQEDTGKEILEKMQAERVTAINYGDYQIQGAPDEVIVDGTSVWVEDLKTTGWDNREFWEQHQLPSAAFQVQIYSWMLSQFDGVSVKNPQINVARRENGDAVDWFTHEVRYDRSEVEEKIDKVLTLLKEPTELPSLRPEEDWKNDHWDEFTRLSLIDDGQQTLGDY